MESLFLKEHLDEFMVEVMFVFIKLTMKLTLWIFRLKNNIKKYHNRMQNNQYRKAIDFGNRQEKAAHDRMVELVEQMLAAKKSLAAAQTDKDSTFYARFCSSLDAQIDDLVFDLYDLSTAERQIVNGAA